MPVALATVQTSLNESQNFEAAKELQGFIEVAEVARELVFTNPPAASWIKKGIEEATGAVLRVGKERRGQAIFWGCMQKHLLKRTAEKDKEFTTKGKWNEPKEAKFACQNCSKNGKPNQTAHLTPVQTHIRVIGEARVRTCENEKEVQVQGY